jgi:hypothetical protein
VSQEDRGGRRPLRARLAGLLRRDDDPLREELGARRRLRLPTPRYRDDPLRDELGPPGGRARLVALVLGLTSAVVLVAVVGVVLAQRWREDPEVPAGPALAVSPAPAPATLPGRSAPSAGYTFTQPPGWTDRTAELRNRVPTEPGVQSQRILSGPASTGLVANISITRTRVPARQRLLDVLRQDFLIGLRNRNRSAEPVGAPIYLEVAGSRATSFEFRYDQRQVQIAGRAVIIDHGRDVYLVLFQTGEVDYDLHVEALWDLLDSWRWL